MQYITCNDDIFHYLRGFKDDVARDNKQLEKKVDNIEQKIEEKLEKMRKQIEENKLEGGSMLEEINKRISVIEKEVFKKKVNVEDEEKKKEKERKKKKEKREEEEKRQKEKSLQEELKEASENEERSSPDETVEKNFEAEANEWIDNHVKNKVKKVEKEDRRVRRGGRGGGGGMSKLKNWFCDSDIEEDEISSEEEAAGREKEWEEVGRKERNIKRKERRKQRKEQLKADTSVKASKIIGIGPVTKMSVDHFEKELQNFEKAKMAAVNEFLQFYLNYEKDEIEDLEIEATQMAKDDIVYIVIKDQSNIHELYRRIAQSQNNDIITRNFIPPQFFERFMHISMRCKDLRESNNNIKTQMRFGRQDIEVMTKVRGSNDPYKLTSLKEICQKEGKPDVIPEFDEKIKWNRKKDKQPRRPLTGSLPKGKPPSMWLVEGDQTNKHQMSRTSSVNTAPKKKSRDEVDDMEEDI